MSSFQKYVNHHCLIVQLATIPFLARTWPGRVLSSSSVAFFPLLGVCVSCWTFLMIISASHTTKTEFLSGFLIKTFFLARKKSFLLSLCLGPKRRRSRGLSQRQSRRFFHIKLPLSFVLLHVHLELFLSSLVVTQKRVPPLYSCDIMSFQNSIF